MNDHGLLLPIPTMPSIAIYYSLKQQHWAKELSDVSRPQDYLLLPKEQRTWCIPHLMRVKPARSDNYTRWPNLAYRPASKNMSEPLAWLRWQYLGAAIRKVLAASASFPSSREVIDWMLAVFISWKKKKVFFPVSQSTYCLSDTIYPHTSERYLDSPYSLTSSWSCTCTGKTGGGQHGYQELRRGLQTQVTY